MKSVLLSGISSLSMSGCLAALAVHFTCLGSPATPDAANTGVIADHCCLVQYAI